MPAGCAGKISAYRSQPFLGGPPGGLQKIPVPTLGPSLVRVYSAPFPVPQVDLGIHECLYRLGRDSSASSDELGVF